ncbi:integrating conjugative element protein [Proteus mirabilis]|uniref:integrating conjugative element protein n=1 Tax=Proteus mirabilis TaxID=584 RepID=UPI000D9C8BC2|nr:integrating conjugative element protein [Proteus mirabilis]SPY36896.1 integrating conjugative element protein, PFL_4695 family [Proteus mirabilis]
MAKSRLIFLFISVGISSCFAEVIPSLNTKQAELIVVADLGGQSTENYFQAISSPDNEYKVSSPSDVLTLSTPSLVSLLPVRTPELTPGYQPNRTLNLSGMSPLFLIGDDNFSRRWLAEKKEQLIELNAVGYVVNVDTETAWDELNELAQGLTLLPVSGSDLALRLGFTHYPVLITDKGLEQ